MKRNVAVSALIRRPWWAQSVATSVESPLTFLLTGRQTGKTETGARWLLDDPDDGTEGLLLVPTYRIGLAALRRMQALGAPMGVKWHQTDGLVFLPSGYRIHVRSADRPDATRGLDRIGRLWLDEVTLISEAAWVATQPCMTVAPNPQILLSGTPKGKGHWTYGVWTSTDPEIVRLRFRTEDSPVPNPKMIKRMRDSMTPAQAAQELDAMFVDDELIPFPPEAVEALFARPLKKRGSKWSLGIDLAKTRDWTVVTAMNEFGEAWIVDRWRHLDWPDTEQRIAAHANSHPGSILILDEGHGHGYGGAVSDYLKRRSDIGKARVRTVKTGNPGVKAELIEGLSADVQYRRVAVDPGPKESAKFGPGGNAAECRSELLRVVGERRVTAGVARIVYPGPINELEHDDCVISLSLANWGRLNAWSQNPDAVDLEDFVEASRW